MSQYKQKTGTDYQGSTYFLQNSSKNRMKSAKTSKRQHSNSKSPKKLLALNNDVHNKEIPNGVCLEEDLLSKEMEIAKMNLKTLQKVDPGIGKILATVPRVVLYHFRGTENVWERTSYEGTLFLYAREPSSDGNGFMILNRLNSENTKEEIPLGMQFREQAPFLLYRKETDDIFGLHIQDKQLFTQTGKLLNRLGRETSSSLLCSTDNNSAPSSQNSSESSAEMDLREVSSHGYLWDQCLSDGIDGSPEGADTSPPPFSAGEGILPKFTDVSTSVISNGDNQIANAKKHASGLHSGTGMTMSNGTGKRGVEEVVPRASSPKEIPKSRRGYSHSNHCLSPRPGPHQVEGLSHSLQKKRTRSPKSHKKPRPVKGGMPGGISSSPHLQNSPVQHASSFDEERGLVGLVEVKMDSNGGESSKSLSQASPYSARSRERVSQGGSDGVSGGDGVADNVIVRKLFPGPTHASQPPPSSPFTMSPAVQTLFFHSPAVNSPFSANFAMSSIGSPHGSLPSQHPESSALPQPALMSALSLDEIEKQMTAEAHALHSYPSSNPLSQKNSTAGLKKAEHKVSLPQVTPSPSAGDNMVLLQPSAFAVPPSPSMSFSSSSSTTIDAASVMPLLLPSVAANVASLKVEPLTPVTIGNSCYSSSSPKFTTHFPAIPPLIHSAGMTAPPLTTKPATARSTTHHREKEGRKEQQASPKDAASRQDCQIPVVQRASSSPLANALLSNNSEVPVDCSAPRRRASTSHAATLISPQQFLDSRGMGGGERAGGKGWMKKHYEKSCKPLTREQLQHSLIHLVQNDEEFMDKIYNAYESLKQPQLSGDQPPKFNI